LPYRSDRQTSGQSTRLSTAGLVNRARELYLECQRLVPTAFEPWYELGAMYAEAGLSAPAKTCLGTSAQTESNNYPLQLNIGRMQFRLGARSASRQAFVAAQALQPQDRKPPYYLGLIAYEENRFESAESYA